MAKKKFNFNEYWGQQLFKVKQGNKDYIWALVRRKYGEDDIERKGMGKNIGVAEEEIYEMETDKDPDSETFGKRIPRKRIVYDTSGNSKEVPAPIERRFKFIHEANAKNIADYKKLVGYTTAFKGTQFYWVFQGRKVTCENPNDFWTLSVAEAKRVAIPQKVTIAPDKPDGVRT